MIVEAHGIPQTVTLTGGDRNDVTHLILPLEAVAPIRGKRGRSLRRPRHLYADRGYDHGVCRDRVRRFEITPYVARRGTEHGSGIGVHRWVVEGAVALLHWFRRLRIRWEIRDHVLTGSAKSMPGPEFGFHEPLDRVSMIWPSVNSQARECSCRFKSLAPRGPAAFCAERTADPSTAT